VEPVQQPETSVADEPPVSLQRGILDLLRELAEPVETLCSLAYESADDSPAAAEAARERAEEGRQILEQLAQLQASLQGAFGAEPEPEEPRVSSPTPLAARSFRLAGPTQKLPVLEALEFLRATKRTGHLSLCFESGEGCLAVSAGEVIGARFGGELGFEALCSILRAGDGYVQFSIDDVLPEERNLAGPTLQLVLSALQCLDERDLELRR
jgi:hypothetical protein